MPQLPQSSDVKNNTIETVSSVLPSQDVMLNEKREQDATNFVETKVQPFQDLVPPNNFVEDRVNSIGERVQKAAGFDPEFEAYFKNNLDRANKEKQDLSLEESKSKFQKMMDSLTVDRIGLEQAKEAGDIGKPVRKAIPPIINGIADAINEGSNALLSLANVSRRAFGVPEMEKLKEYDVFPNANTDAERFIRSTAKLVTELAPISAGLKVAVGLGGIANSIGSATLTGFIFDEKKTPGIISGFLKDNPELAPDALSFINHEIDDNEFQTRLKNGVGFGIDTAVLEVAFFGIKALRGLKRGRESAYQVLENGDVPTTGKVVGMEDVSPAPKQLTDQLVRFDNRTPQGWDNLFAPTFKLKGLTTEETSGKSAADIIREKYKQKVAKIKDLQENGVYANTDREAISNLETMKAALNSPLSVDDLLKMPNNSPVNAPIVLQANMARDAIGEFLQETVLDRVTSGKMTEEEAYIRLNKAIPIMMKLTDPSSTAGRSLQIHQFEAALEAPKYSKKVMEQVKEEFGSGLKDMLEIAILKEKGLTGLNGIDLLIKGMQKFKDPKEVAQWMQEARVNWLMSDPNTFILGNIASNAAMLPVKLAETAVASGVSSIKKQVYGEGYSSRGVHFNEFLAELKGMQHGISEVGKITWENLKTAIDEKTLISPNIKPVYPDNNYKFSIDKVNKEAEAEFARNWKKSTPLAKAFMSIEEIVKGTPIAKTMRVGDSVFKAINYSMELNRQFTILENQLLINAKNKETAEEAATYLSENMAKLNKTKQDVKTMNDSETNAIFASNTVKKINTAAKESAAYGTFTDAQVGTDLHSQTFNALGNLRSKLPGTKILAPFFGFAASASNKVLERTPVLGALIKAKNFSDKGDSTLKGIAGLISGGRDEDTFLAKQGLGFLLASTAAMTIVNLEDNEDFSIAPTGQNNAGFRINGVSIPGEPSNPYYRLLTATSDAMDIINLAKEEDAGDVVATSIASLLAELYTPTNMIEILANISEATSGAKKDVPAKIANLIKNTSLSYVAPYSGMAKHILTTQDYSKPNFGKERGEGLLDEMIQRYKYIYGISEGVPKRIGLFGQEIPYKKVMGWDVSNTAHDMFAGYSIEDPTI